MWSAGSIYAGWQSDGIMDMSMVSIPIASYFIFPDWSHINNKVTCIKQIVVPHCFGSHTLGHCLTFGFWVSSFLLACGLSCQYLEDKN